MRRRPLLLLLCWAAVAFATVHPSCPAGRSPYESFYLQDWGAETDDWHLYYLEQWYSRAELTGTCTNYLGVDAYAEVWWGCTLVGVYRRTWVTWGYIEGYRRPVAVNAYIEIDVNSGAWGSAQSYDNCDESSNGTQSWTQSCQGG
jgi:hypothetical protein